MRRISLVGKKFGFLNAILCAGLGVFLFALMGTGDVSVAIAQENQISDPNTFLFKDPKEYLDELNSKRSAILDEIREIQKELGRVQEERKGVEGQIRRLELQIRNLQLQLRETELSISELSVKIEEGEKAIAETNERILSQKDILSGLLRLMYESGEENIVELMLTEGSLSAIFEEMKYIESVQGELFRVLTRIKQLKEDLEREKADLEEERRSQFRLKAIQQNNALTLHAKEEEQKKILKLKLSEESLLRSRLAERQNVLEEIQRDISLFVLKGTKVTTADIIRIVLQASQRTGVRAPLILGILEVESRLGANVGTGNWRVDMKDNQKDAFLRIVRELGLEPDEVPVSKRVFRNGTLVMWGGAMGPAQFLPTTWELFADEVASLTGNTPPSPWSMEDAITAMSLYLKRYGGDNASGEHAAARAYVGGPGCIKNIRSVCRSYADQVLQKADQWEEYLASLKQ